LRGLGFATHTSRESEYLYDESRSEKEWKKSLDLEKAFFGRDPPKLVFAASFDYNWMQYLEERRKNLDLEKAFFGRDPPKLVFAASFDYN